jgi:hypothetical protein
MKNWANELNFSKGKSQLAKKYMKKCSMSLALKEMQIKTTLKFHLTSVRMVVIKNTNNKWWWGCGGKGNLIHCLWKCKLIKWLWKTIWNLLKKLKIELPYHLAIPLLRI